MASSKLMTSSSPSNQDVQTQNSSSSSLHIHPECSRGYGSAIMDDLFESIYSDSDSFVPDKNSGNCSGNGDRAADEMWPDVVNGIIGGRETTMTLEIFLAKAGLGNGEDVRVSEVEAMPSPTVDVDMIHPVNASGLTAFQSNRMACCSQNALAPERFGTEFVNKTGGGSRGKRRTAVEEEPLDKASQQKQRRMIKNRESAARSRERKQAYTVELESRVTLLEEENSKLLKEEAKSKKERYKQLMENLIPVVEKGRPPRILRRVHSVNW